MTEALEPRVLLAADFSFDASAESDGINALLSSDETNVYLRDGDTDAVLHSQAIVDNNNVVRSLAVIMMTRWVLMPPWPTTPFRSQVVLSGQFAGS